MSRLKVLVLAIAAFDPVWSGDAFEEIRERRLAECMNIPEHEYSTGLLFNPPGYKTYFHRSECIQRLAIDERDLALCDQAMERKSWFFDGSAISPGSCRTAVDRKLDEERAELEQFLRSEPYRIESATIRRNGNGRDYDVLLDASGDYAARYSFSLGIRRATRLDAIFEDSSYYSSSTGTRHLLLRAADLEKRLGSGWRTKEWRLVATLTLVRDGGNRFWYDGIPADAVTHSSEFTLTFDKLPPWTPE